MNTETVTTVTVQVICSHCGESVPPEDIIGGEICQRCYAADFFICDSCGEIIRSSHYCHNGYCEQCCDGDDTDEQEQQPRITRPYSAKNLPEFQSQDSGKYITSKRVFSAEIELQAKREAQESIASSLHSAMGIDYDGSINGDGIEIQTPKLQGLNGEKAILAVCKVLNDYAIDTDRSCGLHIHLDAQDFIGEENHSALYRLFKFYLLADNIILSFLPRSRRKNDYCNPLSDRYSVYNLGNTYSTSDIEKYWYDEQSPDVIANRKLGKDSSRYVGINIHSLLANGHLEIRYHSGTTNPIKILEWTALHQRIVDRCAHSAIEYAPVPGGTLEENTKLFFNAIGLEQRARRYWTMRQRKFLAESNEENQ